MQAYIDTGPQAQTESNQNNDQEQHRAEANTPAQGEEVIPPAAAVSLLHCSSRSNTAPGKERAARKRVKSVVESDDENNTSGPESASEYEMSEEEEEEDFEPDDLTEDEQEDFDDEVAVTKSKKNTPKPSKTPMLTPKGAAEISKTNFLTTPRPSFNSFQTPGTGQKLKSVLENTPTALTSTGASDSTLQTPSRFSERESSRFPFLHPKRIMDRKKRRPDHPEYVVVTPCLMGI